MKKTKQCDIERVDDDNKKIRRQESRLANALRFCEYLTKKKGKSREKILIKSSSFDLTNSRARAHPPISMVSTNQHHR